MTLQKMPVRCGGRMQLCTPRFYCGEQLAQPCRILAPGSRFDAAGHIHRVRLRHANGFGDIFRRQTTCQDDPSVAARSSRQFPIQCATRAAVQSARESIQQYGIRSAVPGQPSDAKSSPNLSILARDYQVIWPYPQGVSALHLAHIIEKDFLWVTSRY